MSLLLVIVLVFIALTAIYFFYSLIWGTPPIINLAVERLGLRMALANPELLTYLGKLDNTLLDFHSGNLTDASPRYMAYLRQLDRDGLALIRRYQPHQLSGQNQLTYDLMCWYFEQNLRGHQFYYHWVANPVFMGPYPVNPVFGVHIDLINFLCTYHKIQGPRSVRRYLSRLGQVAWKLAGLQDSLKSRVEAGIIPPQIVLEKSISQINAFISAPIDENPLYTSFIERLADTDRFSTPASKKWGQRVMRLIEKEVIPAYTNLQSYLQALLALATDEDGLWKLPGGEAYYTYLLCTHTTTALSAEEIHQLGQDEVKRLSDSICAIFDELGLPTDSLGAQLKQLRLDPQYHYHGENRRQSIIDDYQAILDDINQHMPAVFSQGMLDKITVKRLPTYKEPDSPIAYAQAPSMDGSRPGTMWVNLREPDNVYRWGMRTLAYHEGIPGHIYQMAQAQKIRGLPNFRRTYFFNAYVEGWAMYAELLGSELHQPDALSNLGRLQGLLWRAARLVVDTGIHWKKWTRQEAIDYMVTKTGLPIRDVTTEVERYIVMPGQACAYYIGYLKLISLRQKAQATLGDAFDLKDFHNVIINNGGLPLTLLEAVVNDYMDRAAGLQPVDQT